MLAGLEGFQDDDAVIWKPNQSFKKSDRKGGSSREEPPFRLVRYQPVNLSADFYGNPVHPPGASFWACGLDCAAFSAKAQG
jgi:hypothetical protein